MKKLGSHRNDKNYMHVSHNPQLKVESIIF